jgi:hypothetical protein
MREISDKIGVFLGRKEVVCVDDDTLKTEVVVGDGLDTDDDVGTGLGTNLKQPKGLIIFPSLSILLSLNLI